MGAPIRILHLDDNPTDAELVAMMLEDEQERLPTALTYVQTKDEYLAALKRKDFDIILSDFRMPGYDGDDALAAAREVCPDIPFIIVTGELGEEFAVDRLQRGVTDYVLKDRLYRLVPAIKRGLAEAENSRRRLEAESESRKRQKELWAIIQAMHSGVTVLDTEGKLVLVNAAQVAMLGFKDSSAYAGALPDFSRIFELRDAEGHLVPFDDWPAIRIMHGETIVNRELKGRRMETGQERYLSFTGQPVWDENGKQILSVVVTRDITERKEAEGALHQSEERFAATFMGSPIPLSISRVRDGMVLEVNDALLKLYGAERDEVVGKTTFELGIWPDLRERERILGVIARKGKIYESETRLLSRSLGERQVLVTVTLLRAGEEPLVLSLLNDITEQTRMEASLRESEARFRTLADTTPVMLWVTDARGDIEMVNRAWEEFFGVREAQVKPPGTWRVLVHPEDRQAYVEAYMKAVQSRSAFKAEARVKHASGEWRWVHSVSVPRIAADGTFLGHVGSSPDMTESTAALQMANQELEAFSYSVAHDLKAPLRLIKGFARLLARQGRDNLTGKLWEYLAAIQTQTGYMEGLIEDLLEFSRLSRKEPHLLTIDTRQMVVEVVAEQRQILDAEAGQRVRVDIGELPEVEADPVLLRIVFSNLLSNAFKFTRVVKEPVIQIKAERNEGFYRFCIIDNGVGFPRGKAEKLFRVFQRLHPPGEFEGHGVGLATVRRIVERHGGEVSGEGEQGRGASFSFTLPFPGLLGR